MTDGTAPRSPDPAFRARFVVEIDDVEIGAFTEVSGLTVEVTVEELREGGQNEFMYKLPGPRKHPNLVLKAGVTNADELFGWFTRAGSDVDGGSGLTRSNGKLELRDASGQPVRTWSFAGAFPVKWTGPQFAASSSDLAVEELEIAHHGFVAG